VAIDWDWPAPTCLPGIGLINASGSFRGAWFRLDSYETTVGRRHALHEYPLRNLPLAEDLGRKARRFNFAAYILGPGWEVQRDLLINACEADGPATLVHPFHGTHRVLCDTCTVSEGRASGRRFARFSLDFIEAGDYQTVYYAADPGNSLLEQAGGGYGVAEGAF
jgi:prophage DNA circulation protein